jgi:hypothetical protein
MDVLGFVKEDKNQAKKIKKQILVTMAGNMNLTGSHKERRIQ